eukprot:TRINITY_DN613_c0_g2_i1.p1 TRINITY_DN613_c0_g2~~TRINITY_DN613_c0_g2_i1.p1  ORF type:complete len:276 (+),score=5.37 TRINITY_DN613_c0_g2_i1:1-828(+)
MTSLALPVAPSLLTQSVDVMQSSTKMEVEGDLALASLKRKSDREHSPKKKYRSVRILLPEEGKSKSPIDKKTSKPYPTQITKPVRTFTAEELARQKEEFERERPIFYHCLNRIAGTVESTKKHASYLKISYPTYFLKEYLHRKFSEEEVNQRLYALYGERNKYFASRPSLEDFKKHFETSFVEEEPARSQACNWLKVHFLTDDLIDFTKRIGAEEKLDLFLQILYPNFGGLTAIQSLYSGWYRGGKKVLPQWFRELLSQVTQWEPKSTGLMEAST